MLTSVSFSVFTVLTEFYDQLYNAFIISDVCNRSLCVIPFETEMAKNQEHFDPVVAGTKITVSTHPPQALLNPVLFASLSPFPQPAPVSAAISCQSTPENYQAFIRIKN